MSEIFNEIDDELRREQLKKIWDKYSVYIVAAALLIIAGVAGWRGYEYVATKNAVKATPAIAKAMSTGTDAAGSPIQLTASTRANPAIHRLEGTCRLTKAAMD